MTKGQEWRSALILVNGLGANSQPAISCGCHCVIEKKPEGPEWGT